MNKVTGPMPFGGSTNPPGIPVGQVSPNHGYYVREFVEVATPELIYDSFGGTATIPDNNSNEINYNKIELDLNGANLTLAEGVTPTSQSLVVNRIKGEVGQYGGFAIVTDRLTTESINGLTSELNSRLAEQAGQFMNKVVRDGILASANIRRSSASGAPANDNAITTAGVTVGDFSYLYTALFKAHAKPFRPLVKGSPNFGTTTASASYYVIVPVEALAFLETLDDGNGGVWQPAHKYAAARQVMDNELGMFKNFTFIADTECLITTNTAATPQLIAHSPVIAKGAYSVTRMGGRDIEIIVKSLGSSGVVDALNQRASYGWKARKGAVIHNPEFLHVLRYSIGNA